MPTNILKILAISLTLIVFFKIYDSCFSNQPTTEDILTSLYQKEQKLYTELKDVKSKKPYKAVAFAIDDEGYLVCWYTYDMQNQKIADQIALENCNKASEKLKVNKECKLYNDIFSRL